MGHVLLYLPTGLTPLRALLAMALLFVCVRTLPRQPRRFAGGALMLVSLAVFRLATRTLPDRNPLRVWALSMSDTFPLRWRDLARFSSLDPRRAAPAPAD